MYKDIRKKGGVREPQNRQVKKTRLPNNVCYSSIPAKAHKPPCMLVHTVSEQGEKHRRLETQEDEECGLWQGRRGIISFVFRHLCITMNYY